MKQKETELAERFSSWEGVGTRSFLSETPKTSPSSWLWFLSFTISRKDMTPPGPLQHFHLWHSPRLRFRFRKQVSRFKRFLGISGFETGGGVSVPGLEPKKAVKLFRSSNSQTASQLRTLLLVHYAMVSVFLLSAPIIIWSLTWIVILETFARIPRVEVDAKLITKPLIYKIEIVVSRIVCLKTLLEPTFRLRKTHTIESPLPKFPFDRPRWVFLPQNSTWVIDNWIHFVMLR